jgi:NADP-dependent 3-hydroxy acid dehydrogenase YdfG
VIDLNLRTALVTTEAAIPEMRARCGGALLYTASTSGLVSSGFSPVYPMAKLGVVVFVRALTNISASHPTRSVSTPSTQARSTRGCCPSSSPGLTSRVRRRTRKLSS